MTSRIRSVERILGGWRLAVATAWPLAALTAAMAAVLVALAPVAGAQDGGDTPAATGEPAEPAGAADSAETPAPAQAEDDEAADAEAARDGDDSDVFVPTEEIAADEEVVFPVDI